MQQNITVMLQFCASELALSSVTSQVICLMDQVSQLTLPSSFIFLMLYIQWKREHSHKEDDSGQRYTITTPLSQNLLSSSNIHWVPTMHQVRKRVKKKPLALSEEEDTDSTPEAKPHHPEVWLLEIIPSSWAPSPMGIPTYTITLTASDTSK